MRVGSRARLIGKPPWRRPWKIVAFCSSSWTWLLLLLFAALPTFGQNSCSGKAGDRLNPGTYTIQTCVPVGKCVSRFDENAYCSKYQSSCTPKSPDCDFSSACYAAPDGSNKGVTSTAVVAGVCRLDVGKDVQLGELCTFTTTVAAAGHLDCHCECGTKRPVPRASGTVVTPQETLYFLMSTLTPQQQKKLQNDLGPLAAQYDVFTNTNAPGVAAKPEETAPHESQGGVSPGTDSNATAANSNTGAGAGGPDVRGGPPTGAPAPTTDKSNTKATQTTGQGGDKKAGEGKKDDASSNKGGDSGKNSSNSVSGTGVTSSSTSMMDFANERWNVYVAAGYTAFADPYVGANLVATLNSLATAYPGAGIYLSVSGSPNNLIYSPFATTFTPPPLTFQSFLPFIGARPTGPGGAEPTGTPSWVPSVSVSGLPTSTGEPGDFAGPGLFVTDPNFVSQYVLITNNFGLNYGAPQVNLRQSRIVNTWQAQDNWNYVLGKHQLKGGVNWTYLRSPNVFLPGINSGWPALNSPKLKFRDYDTYTHFGDDWPLFYNISWSSVPPVFLQSFNSQPGQLLVPESTGIGQNPSTIGPRGIASFGNDFVKETWGVAKLDTMFTNNFANELGFLSISGPSTDRFGDTDLFISPGMVHLLWANGIDIRPHLTGRSLAAWRTAEAAGFGLQQFPSIQPNAGTGPSSQPDFFDFGNSWGDQGTESSLISALNGPPSDSTGFSDFSFAFPANAQEVTITLTDQNALSETDVIANEILTSRTTSAPSSGSAIGGTSSENWDNFDQRWEAWMLDVGSQLPDANVGASTAAVGTGSAGESSKTPEYLQTQNTETHISSVTGSGAAGEAPKETIQLNPSQVQYEYKPLKKEEEKTPAGEVGSSATAPCFENCAMQGASIGPTTAMAQPNPFGASTYTGTTVVTPGVLNVASEAAVGNAVPAVVQVNAPGLSGRQLVAVIFLYTDSPPVPGTTSDPTSGTSGSAQLLGPDDLELRLDAEGRAVLVRGPWELATLNTASSFTLQSGTASWMTAPLPTAPPQQVKYWLEANGNSAGEAFNLSVEDPSGQFKKLLLPEGVVLQPAAPPQKQAKQAGNALKQSVAAVCLEEAKLPPAPGMLYKIADQATQQQYKPVRYLMRALRKAAASGQITPDSPMKDYYLFLQQYLTWAVFGGWNEQQFTEHWIDRTKKSAQAMKMAWTPQMEDMLRAAAPHRWGDISKVRETAEAMMRSELSPGQ